MCKPSWQIILVVRSWDFEYIGTGFDPWWGLSRETFSARQALIAPAVETTKGITMTGMVSANWMQ